MQWAMRWATLRPIRRWLRSIERHSARRERTVWMKLSDRLFLASPLLAVVAALLCHALVRESSVATLVQGRLGRDDVGRIHGWLLTGEETGYGQAPVGEFQVCQQVVARGWPLPTQEELGAPFLEARRFIEDRTPGAVRAADDPKLRPAIDAAIAESRPDVSAALAAPGTSMRRSGLAWAGNIALWLVVLALGLPVVVQGLRLLAFVAFIGPNLRREWRAVSGLCPNCGYDVRGSAWSERCPECGSLLE